MSYSVCLIDDQIPAKKISGYDDSGLISSSMLKHMIENEVEWDEPPLRELIHRLLENEELSLLKAFTNPNFYFQYKEVSTYAPEIMIFDWDYPDADDTEEQLLKILEGSFTLVFIFTGIDKVEQVKAQLKHEKFQNTSNRVIIFEKGEEDAVEKLLTSVKDKMKDNFSFNFGKELRLNCTSSIDKILVELGKVSVNQIGHYLQIGGEDRQDFIEFIGERFKNHLVVSDKIQEFELDEQPDPKEVEDLSPKIWSHRLYHFEKNDKKVRKGDIVKGAEGTFLIVTADCDLNDHMKKNFGYVSLVKLHPITKDNDYLIEQISNSRSKQYFEKKVKKQETYFWITSISNPVQGLSGPVMVPFLEINNELKNYLLFPKEIESYLFILSDESTKKYLKYDDKFPFEKVAAISEPFKTPLIQHILYILGGYGAPDYPKNIQNHLAQELGKIFL